jgi:pimeloyl-ACP methyl ester carboxylesterase
VGSRSPTRWWGWVSNLVYGWEIPHFRAFYDRLAESFRLILFDKRGTGLSDLGGHFPALETRMDDVRAVLDAVGSSRAVLLAAQDGCSMAALHAATYPERTQALILFHPVAHNPQAQSEEVRAELAQLRESWGMRGSWVVKRHRRFLTASSPPCCSPTSSARRSGPQCSAIAAGANSWSVTTRLSGGS